MDFQLTEQQRRMVAAVRDLAQGEFKANAQKYMDGTFPWENMKKLADIGVLALETRRDVPRDRDGPQHPLSCLYHSQSVSRSFHGGGGQDHMQRDVQPGHQRGDPVARR